jgi:CheY-like chemotaxis protein
MHTPAGESKTSLPQPDVLVVDDDPDLLETMHTMLDLEGYEVRCVRNGQEALEAAAEKLPGVVLLDMLMPVMNGWECARELRARFGQRVPIVVVTAAEHAHARAARIGGVAGVLQKPFDMDDLLEIVSRYVPRKTPLRRS